MDLWPPQSFWRKSHKQWLVIPTTPVGPQHRCILNSTRCKKIYKSIFQNIQTNFPKYTNQFFQNIQTNFQKSANQFSKIYKPIFQNIQTNFPKYTNQFPKICKPIFQNIQTNFSKIVFDPSNQNELYYPPLLSKMWDSMIWWLFSKRSL